MLLLILAQNKEKSLNHYQLLELKLKVTYTKKPVKMQSRQYTLLVRLNQSLKRLKNTHK